MTATLTGGNDEQHKKGTAHRRLPPIIHGGKKQASVDESIGRERVQGTQRLTLGLVMMLCSRSILLVWTCKVVALHKWQRS